MNFIRKALILFTFVFFSLSLPGFAQGTIFEVPSPEKLERGEVILNSEFAFRPYDPEHYFLYNGFTSLGLGRGYEFNLSVINIETPDPEHRAIVTGFKKVFDILKDKYPEREFRWTAGSLVAASLDGKGVGNWSYTHLRVVYLKLTHYSLQA